jgi:hypothetical protein
LFRDIRPKAKGLVEANTEFERTTPRRALRPKARVRPPVPSAPTTYPVWKAAAVELMGGKPGTLPQREWRWMFILGVDPAEAAKQAQLYREGMSAARASKIWSGKLFGLPHRLRSASSLCPRRH